MVRWRKIIKINESFEAIILHFYHLFSHSTGDYFPRGQKELPQLLQSHLQYLFIQIKPNSSNK